MLVKALITRLAGGSSSTSSKETSGHGRFSKSVYEKYPVLPSLILRLLPYGTELEDDYEVLKSQTSVAVSMRIIQMAFPAMEIIERFGIPPAHRDIVKCLLLRQLDSPVWTLREKAAKILSSSVNELDMINEIQRFLLLRYKPQNSLHGRLSYLRHAIQSTSLQVLGLWSRMPPLP